MELSSWLVAEATVVAVPEIVFTPAEVTPGSATLATLTVNELVRTASEPAHPVAAAFILPALVAAVSWT